MTHFCDKATPILYQWQVTYNEAKKWQNLFHQSQWVHVMPCYSVHRRRAHTHTHTYTHIRYHSIITSFLHAWTHVVPCSILHVNCQSFPWNLYLNQKHPGCKKRSGQELKKGWDKKEMKSKWAAKACVVLLLTKIKF